TMQILFAEELVGESDRHQQGNPLETVTTAARWCQLPDLGVDVVGELLDVAWALIAADDELLAGDLDFDGLLHRITSRPRSPMGSCRSMGQPSWALPRPWASARR